MAAATAPLRLRLAHLEARRAALGANPLDNPSAWRPGGCALVLRSLLAYADAGRARVAAAIAVAVRALEAELAEDAAKQRQYGVEWTVEHSYVPTEQERQAALAALQHHFEQQQAAEAQEQDHEQEHNTTKQSKKSKKFVAGVVAIARTGVSSGAFVGATQGGVAAPLLRGLAEARSREAAMTAEADGLRDTIDLDTDSASAASKDDTDAGSLVTHGNGDESAGGYEMRAPEELDVPAFTVPTLGLLALLDRPVLALEAQLRALHRAHPHRRAAAAALLRLRRGLAELRAETEAAEAAVDAFAPLETVFIATALSLYNSNNGNDAQSFAGDASELRDAFVAAARVATDKVEATLAETLRRRCLPLLSRALVAARVAATIHATRAAAVAEALAHTVQVPAESAMVKFTQLHNALTDVGDRAWALVAEPVPDAEQNADSQAHSTDSTGVNKSKIKGPVTILVERSQAALVSRRATRGAAAAKLLSSRLFQVRTD